MFNLVKISTNGFLVDIVLVINPCLPLTQLSMLRTTRNSTKSVIVNRNRSSIV